MTQPTYEVFGLILFTGRYEACVAFYETTLGLPVQERQASLTRFGWGDGYLMVERGGVASDREKSFAQNPVTLRLNVADVEASAALLRQRGVEVTVRRWDWGITGLMLDPDGNRVELRDRFRA